MFNKRKGEGLACDSSRGWQDKLEAASAALRNLGFLFNGVGTMKPFGRGAM